MYLDSGDNNNALLHNMAMRDFPSIIGKTPLLKGTQEITHYPHMEQSRTKATLTFHLLFSFLIMGNTVIS